MRKVFSLDEMIITAVIFIFMRELSLVSIVGRYRRPVANPCGDFVLLRYLNTGLFNCTLNNVSLTLLYNRYSGKSFSDIYGMLRHAIIRFTTPPNNFVNDYFLKILLTYPDSGSTSDQLISTEFYEENDLNIKTENTYEEMLLLAPDVEGYINNYAAFLLQNDKTKHAETLLKTNR